MKQESDVNKLITKCLRRVGHMGLIVFCVLLVLGTVITQTGCSSPEERIQEERRAPERSHEEAMDQLEERKEE